MKERMWNWKSERESGRSWKKETVVKMYFMKKNVFNKKVKYKRKGQ